MLLVAFILDMLPCAKAILEGLTTIAVVLKRVAAIAKIAIFAYLVFNIENLHARLHLWVI
jgi:hypothetical protein